MINASLDSLLLLEEFSVRAVNYGSPFFSIIYGPSAKRAGHIKSMEKKTSIRNLHFGGPETSAGRAIWQSFDRCQERKFLLAHENNSAQQRVSEKVKTNSPCWKSLFGQN